MREYNNVKDCLVGALPENVRTDAIIQQDDNLWQIIFGHEVLTVEVDPQLNRVAFSIQSTDEFKKVSQEKLVLMLQYSYVWRVTSGVYFSMTENEQPVIMIYFKTDEISIPLVRNIAFDLLDKFSIWKDILK